jgi:hypothetical protein
MAQSLEGSNPRGVVVEAGNVGECFATRVQKILTPFTCNFF